ncbi:HAD family hydrolase [uncultured Thiothrix sp.]|uniref:HAD family hydrolase n=1 Tax=uncultured Thiothrix sp. TaxID=223185 RepID=UPI002615AB6B|nr:HAD family hydrolase [uncultured Thiothrix sp.]
MPHPLLARKFWIFDMDGTLTLSKHDFSAIRRALGLPPDQTILESLAALPPETAAPLYERLQAIELEIAKRSEAAEGAQKLLSYLRAQGARVGVLTRNSALNTQVTLAAAGLDQHFTAADLISRDCAPPKPHPAGIHRLLAQWQAEPHEAVMVGDFVYDLQAGRAAGTTTLYIDPSAAFPAREHADWCVASLAELLA